MEKTCTKCLQIKSLDNFYKNRSECKFCTKSKMNSYYQLNSYNIKQKKQQNYKLNSIPAKKASQKWRLAHLEVDKKNKSTYHRLQMKNNPIYKLRHSLRIRLKKAILNNHKSGSAIKDLGCSIETFKKHIESIFQPGMSWDNWGQGLNKWNLDHIEPLFKFNLTDSEQLKKACYYLNLQPLWQKDHELKTSEDLSGT
jgi:hypothetical protein